MGFGLLVYLAVILKPSATLKTMISPLSVAESALVPETKREEEEEEVEGEKETRSALDQPSDEEKSDSWTNLQLSPGIYCPRYFP